MKMTEGRKCRHQVKSYDYCSHTFATNKIKQNQQKEKGREISYLKFVNNTSNSLFIVLFTFAYGVCSPPFHDQYSLQFSLAPNTNLNNTQELQACAIQCCSLLYCSYVHLLFYAPYSIQVSVRTHAQPITTNAYPTSHKETQSCTQPKGKKIQQCQIIDILQSHARQAQHNPEYATFHMSSRS